MTRTTRILSIALAGGLALGTVGTAAASTVTLAQQGGTVFQDANGNNAWQVGQNVTYRNEDGNGFTTQNLNAGVFRLTADGEDFLAYCVDLFNAINVSADYHRDDFLFTGQTRDRIDALASNATVTNSRTASAFQLALWEIVTDEDLNLAIGDFVVNNRNNNNPVTDATAWLTNITNGTWTATGVEFTFLQSDDSQNLVAFGLGGPTPIPLPAAGWMLIAGMGALFAAKRRAAA